MSLNWMRDVPREHRFEPRVDGMSITLDPVSGEKGEATVNDEEMSHDYVVVWRKTSSPVAKRFRTTGVSNSELQVLNGVSAGSGVASKAMVLDSGRDISNIRVLTSTSLVTTNLTASGLTTFDGTVGFNSTVTLNGTVVSTNATFRDVRIGSTYKLQLDYGTTVRDMVRREASTSTTVYFGNASDIIKIQSSNTHLYHRRGSTDYKVWTEASDGAGSGLDADTLDSLEASSFLRSDVNHRYTGLISGSRNSDEQFRIGYNVSRSPFMAFYRGLSRRAYIQWKEINKVLRLYNGYYNEYLDIGGDMSGLRWNVGGTPYTVWHSGNDGSGSGLDADTLDGVSGGSFLRSNADDTFTTQLTGSRTYRPFYASSSTNSAKYMFNHSGSYCMGIGSTGSNQIVLGICNNTGSWRTDYNGLEINAANGYVVLKPSGNENASMLLGDPNGHTTNHRYYVSNDSWGDVTMYVSGAYTTQKYVYVRNLNISAGMYDFRHSYYRLYVGGPSYSTGGWSGSDIRRKKNVKNFTVDGILEKMSVLRPVTYNWKKSYIDDQGTYLGYIAQEVEKLFPNLVLTDDTGYKALAYDRIPVLNTMAIKELYRKLQEKGVLD